MISVSASSRCTDVKADEGGRSSLEGVAKVAEVAAMIAKEPAHKIGPLPPLFAPSPRRTLIEALESFNRTEGRGDKWIALATRIDDPHLALLALHDLLHHQPELSVPNTPSFHALLNQLFALSISVCQRYDAGGHAYLLNLGMMLEVETIELTKALTPEQRTKAFQHYFKRIFSEAFSLHRFFVWDALIPHLKLCDFSVVLEGFTRMLQEFYKTPFGEKESFLAKIEATALLWIDHDINQITYLTKILADFTLFSSRLLDRLKPTQQLLFLRHYLRLPSLERWEAAQKYPRWCPNCTLTLFRIAATLDPPPDKKLLISMRQQLMQSSFQQEQLSEILEVVKKFELESPDFSEWHGMALKQAFEEELTAAADS